MNWLSGLVCRYNLVKDRLERACRRAGVGRGDVTLLAVSKFHPAQAIAHLASHGQLDFGENYVQEATLKRQELEAGGLTLRWHMIGPVQSRKAFQVAGKYALLHSLGSVRLADALEKRLLASGAVQKALIEVNLGEEKQKYGIAPAELAGFVAHVLGACPHLSLQGLMCIPPLASSPEESRPFFARLRALRDGLEKSFGVRLPELSMGMSSDFEAAVEEGATIVRVGTDIFGERPIKKSSAVER